MRRRRSGVSAVIGTAIALAIIFTILVPLVLYMQSLQTLFMQETSRRLQYELERLHEKLEVYASLGKDVIHGNRLLYIILENPGTLSVSIPTIYVESEENGLRKYDVNVFLAPGEKIESMNLTAYGVSINPPDDLRVKVVTMRGNGFYSNEIGPANLPYTILVSVKNMTAGYSYEVKVQVRGDYGCVSAGLGSGSLCSNLASYFIYSQTMGEEGLAAFMAAPGEYTVNVVEHSPTGGSATPVPSKIIEVFKDVIVNFTIPEIHLPDKVPLRVFVPAGEITHILTARTGAIEIPFQVSLGNVSEPMKNIQVKITITNEIGLDYATLPTDSITINRLSPGETYSSTFTINIRDDTAKGGFIEYKIEIQSATGTFTGNTYGKSDLENPTIIQDIIICRLGGANNNKPVCNVT